MENINLDLIADLFILAGRRRGMTTVDQISANYEALTEDVLDIVEQTKLKTLTKVAPDRALLEQFAARYQQKAKK